MLHYSRHQETASLCGWAVVGKVADCLGDVNIVALCQGIVVT